jgi:hypothetical protein
MEDEEIKFKGGVTIIFGGNAKQVYFLIKINNVKNDKNLNKF